MWSCGEGFLSASALEDLQLAEELARTCYEMYEVTATGLAPEIAYFNVFVSTKILSKSQTSTALKDSVDVCIKLKYVFENYCNLVNLCFCRRRMWMWKEGEQIQFTNRTYALSP